MLRRSIVEISSRRAVRRIPRHLAPRVPSFISSQKEFSTVSKQGAKPAPSSPGKPPKSGSPASKFVLGSVAFGAAFLAAYQTGYLEQYLGKEQHSSSKTAQDGVGNEDLKDVQYSRNPLVSPNTEESKGVSAAVQLTDLENETHPPQPEDATEKRPENDFQVPDKSNVVEEGTVVIKENQLPEYPQSSEAPSDQSKESNIPFVKDFNIKNTEANTDMLPDKGSQTPVISTQTSTVPEENETETTPFQNQVVDEGREDALGKGKELPSSLLETYNLGDTTEESTATSLHSQVPNKNNKFPKEQEVTAFISATEDSNDGYISKDGKLVLDFLQAIHATETRQAELDAHAYNEEKRALKEKYEKELKDAAARELMRAEEAAMLDKELKRERTKAANAIKSLQEKMEEKLKTELEQKESEAETNLKKVQELAKAELNAAIANEKAVQIDKMAEANLNINALCMAFYARSEEARQTHAAHKLALGALALEDALSKGLPIQTEIEALRTYLEGIDKDSILDLVLSSLPEETRNNGTDTQLQLNQKFDAIKGTLRHFSFIPSGGGGILAHSLAHVASMLKVREPDQSGDGIESVISKVESYLAEGKLAEAANVLEEGVRGTQAAEIVGHWVRLARNRAITEQALILLQSYATSISLT
ncbi:Formation of crista junctions 1 [Quillaja saponaria]|uniref:Formation of crista junctions 1 n=1 Tax=Quillaja saponaria TaxID=32244 RepID=A0AAD7LET5_QUISA|nr:Formation of crista junctions 1 [Quillaja saponaria]